LPSSSNGIDHDAFCLIQAKRMNVIDCKKLSMLFSEKWFPLFDSML